MNPGAIVAERNGTLLARFKTLNTSAWQRE